jgi:hypothetical protein
MVSKLVQCCILQTRNQLLIKLTSQILNVRGDSFVHDIHAQCFDCFHVHSFPGLFSTLNIKTTCSSETSVDFPRATCCSENTDFITTDLGTTNPTFSWVLAKCRNVRRFGGTCCPYSWLKSIYEGGAKKPPKRRQNCRLPKDKNVQEQDQHRNRKN